MKKEHKKLIKEYAADNYTRILREPSGILKHKFIVPGACYNDSLWDWDSYFTDIAISQLVTDGAEKERLREYQRGCVINFLEHTRKSGCTPHLLTPDRDTVDEAEEFSTNMHKPVLAQHCAFLLKREPDDIMWLEPCIDKLDAFLKGYMQHCRHENGLYFWIDDAGIGVDNDPATFYRPKKSSASIFLNCFMYKELSAFVYICKLFKRKELAGFYEKQAEDLKQSVRKNCWDEHDGFFYSADLNNLPIDPNQRLHRGCPRHWDCLIQRIGVWSGFLALWSGIATKEQAKRIVNEHLLADDSFNAKYGIRTLANYEKMYVIKKSGNPSCWLGPVWGISNYLVFRGLVKYGFTEQAEELAEKTVALFGNDIERQGCMSEYYHPDTGESVNNPGFQNWNLLSLNIMAFLDGEPYVEEF